MIRMIIAMGFWGLAIYLAASKFALAVANPLIVLLAAFGMRFLEVGMPIWIFLVMVGLLWFGFALEIAFQGLAAMRRDQPDKASRKWTISISLVGLALTFAVAIQSSQASLHSIQRTLSYGGSVLRGGTGNDH